MKRDSIVFYRSFYEAINEMPLDMQGKIYSAIFEYSLNFNEVVLEGLPKAIFILIKPQLDANIKRYENGLKGGRKKQEEPKPNQTKTKTNQTKTKAKTNDNDNDNDNDSSFKEEPSQIVNPKYELPEDASESHFEFLKNNYASTLYEKYKRSEDFKQISKLNDKDQKTFIKRFDAKCLEIGIPYNGSRIAGRLKSFTDSWVSNLKTNSKKGML